MRDIVATGWQLGDAPANGKAGLTRRPKASPGTARGAMLAAGAKPKVLVGTPAYGGMVHVDYVRSLFDMQRAGIAYQLATLGNESLITRARNTILSAFHVRLEFSHLLFLDADTHLPGAALTRMLAMDVPVIGAAVALKAPNTDGARIWNVGRSLGSHGTLLKVENIGTAALLLSRVAVGALVQDAIEHGRTYARAGTTQGDFDAEVHYDVFRVGVHEGVYLSEDYWACRRLHALGFDIHVDPSVITSHHGVVPV